MSRRMTIAGLFVAIVLAVSQAGPAAGYVGTPPVLDAGQEPDSAAVVAVVEAFHAALEQADTAAVRGLLAADAIVQEGGVVETRAEYFSHHLPADMAFAGAVQAERRVMTVEVRNDVAWVASASHRTGTFRDREIDLQGAELMVLTRGPDGWRISAIHWSSRSRS